MVVPGFRMWSLEASKEKVPKEKVPGLASRPYILSLVSLPNAGKEELSFPTSQVKKTPKGREGLRT